MFGTSGFLVNTGNSRFEFLRRKVSLSEQRRRAPLYSERRPTFPGGTHDACCARTEAERFFAESAGRRQRLSAGSGRGPVRLLAWLLGELLHGPPRSAQGDVLQAGRHALPR